MKRWVYVVALAALLAASLVGAYSRQWWRETRAPDWRGMAFSDDGHLLALAGGYGNIAVWDVALGHVQQRLRIGRTIWTVDFSPDGRTLAVGTGAANPYLNRDQEVQIWDAVSGQRIFRLQGAVDNVLSLAFNPTGTIVAAGSLDETATAWDVRSGHTVSECRGPRPYARGIQQVAFTQDGTWIAGGRGEDVLVWDASGGNPLRALGGGGDKALEFLDDTRLLAFDGSEARVWDVRTGKLKAHRGLDQHGHIAIAPWADLAVLADANGGVDLVRAHDLFVESSARLEPSPVRPAVAPNGDFVATREENRVHLWAVERDRQGHRLLSLRWSATVSERGAPAGWLDMQFGGEGRYLAVGESQRVVVFEVDSGRVRLTCGRALDVVRKTP